MTKSYVVALVVSAFAAGFGGGWIVRDVTQDDSARPTVTQFPKCTEAQELRRRGGANVLCTPRESSGSSGNPLDDLDNPLDR